jgi:hypothetical protein
MGCERMERMGFSERCVVCLIKHTTYLQEVILFVNMKLITELLVSAAQSDVEVGDYCNVLAWW